MDESQKATPEASTVEPQIISVSDPEMMKTLASFIYVNGTELASNNWDVRIAFGERLPDGSSAARVGIVMSHQHFKAFVQAVTIQLAKLEEVMGEIHFIPVNIAPPKAD